MEGQQLIIMKSAHPLILLSLLLAAASAASIRSDSYVDLPQAGYAFSFSDAQGPVQLTIAGLPQGLAVKDYTVAPVGPVQPGQYILSVKAQDTAGKDEKILIMNVNSSFTVYKPTQPAPQPTPTSTTTTVTTTTSSSSLSTSSSSSSSSSSAANSSLDISSISALFQPDQPHDLGISGVGSGDTASVDSLQSYFNSIDTSGSGQAAPAIGKELNQILTDFSNASSSTGYANVSSVSAESIVSQNSISLNFSRSDRTTVSTEEAAKLFQAQKQAGEWVAGNYSAVLQLTADKNTLNLLIANLTEHYQADQQAQKDAAELLNAANTNKSKIDSAITNLNAFLASLNTQINASSTRLAQLQAQKQDLASQATKTQSSSQQVSDSIQALSLQVQSGSAALTSNIKTCESHNGNLLQANKTLNILNSQLGLVGQQLTGAANDIAARRAVVDDLTRQLQAAQQLLQLAINNSNQLAAQRTDLQQNISSATSAVSALAQTLTACTAQSATLKQTLAAQQANLTALQTTQAQIANTNSSQASQLTTLQAQIAQETASYNGLQSQTTSAAAALTLLQAALPNATSVLAALSSSKAQADLLLQEDLATLQAAIASFKNESASLQMATMHLQNARALSQQADQAVNNMLALKGNVLPFAVAVDSSQKALIGQTVVSPSLSIANWFNYLSANFGTAAFPYQSQRVDCLYPFSLAALNLRNTIPCPAPSDPLQTVTGKVLRISSFNEVVLGVDSSSSQLTVDIPSCATLSSNVGGYKVSVGDSALVKGVQNGNTIVAKSIVFLQK